MVSDSSMGIAPPFLCSCGFSNKGRVVLLNWGWWKEEYPYLLFDWLAVRGISDFFLKLHFFERQVCLPKTSVDELRALKLTLTRQFTGISLRTRPGTNYRTSARVFFASSPSNLPPCQWSQTKEVALGAQQTLLTVLMGCQQNCFKPQQSLWEAMSACRVLQSKLKSDISKKIEEWPKMWDNCFGEHHSPLEHGICHNPLLSMEWIWVGLQTALLWSFWVSLWLLSYIS